jgi:hypothetical protein
VKAHQRQIAAEQMERDGIRSIASKGGCGHVEEHDGVRIGCKNPHRYQVRGVGKLCFTHAIQHASINADPSPLSSDGRFEVYSRRVNG